MDIIHRTYLASEVAAATGATPRDIQNWALRVMVGHRVGGGGGKGKRRQFSFNNLMEVAIAKAILDVGSRNVEAAFGAAADFSHYSDGGSGWGSESPSAMRLPALPFHHSLGETRLLVHGDQGMTVLEAPRNAELSKEFGELRAMRYLGNPPVYIVVNASTVFMEVCRRLGVDFRHVLDAAYPNEAS